MNMSWTLCRGGEGAARCKDSSRRNFSVVRALWARTAFFCLRKPAQPLSEARKETIRPFELPSPPMYASRKIASPSAIATQVANTTSNRQSRSASSRSSAFDGVRGGRSGFSNEALRRQLRDKEPVSVSLASARKHLQKAAELLLNGEGNAHAHEKEIERWDRVIQSHPEQIMKEEAARTLWLETHAGDRAEARRFIRSLVPPGVWNGVKLADLEGHGLSKACAKRIFQMPALWLCRAEAERVAKFHVADLRGRYAYDRLTLLELRAVFVSLPAFSDEAKAAWKQGLEDKLRQFETGDLPPAKVRPPCFAGVEGPFDPDADDAVMAPAAREVVLTPVTAAARAAPSAAAAAPRAEPSAAAPVATPANPGNDLMAAIRARSDKARSDGAPDGARRALHGV